VRDDPLSDSDDGEFYECSAYEDIFDDDSSDEESVAAVIAGAEKKNTTAMKPDNVLVPWPELQAHLESTPCSKCLGKNAYEHQNNPEILWRPSLDVKAYPWGAMSDVVITCKECSHQSVICPAQTSDIGAPDNKRRRTNAPEKKYNAFADSKFRHYPINYQIIL
jgi:hypothetical protein